MKPADTIASFSFPGSAAGAAALKYICVCDIIWLINYDCILLHGINRELAKKKLIQPKTKVHPLEKAKRPVHAMPFYRPYPLGASLCNCTRPIGSRWTIDIHWPLIGKDHQRCACYVFSKMPKVFVLKFHAAKAAKAFTCNSLHLQFTRLSWFWEYVIIIII